MKKNKKKGDVMEKVNNKTRASKTIGKVIVCPKCDGESRVYHFSWSAIQCCSCKSDIDKTDWFIQKPSNVFMVGKLFEKFLEKEKGLNLEGCGTLISKKGLECRDLEFSYFGKHYTLSINDGGAA